MLENPEVSGATKGGRMNYYLMMYPQDRDDIHGSAGVSIETNNDTLAIEQARCFVEAFEQRLALSERPARATLYQDSKVIHSW